MKRRTSLIVLASVLAASLLLSLFVLTTPQIPSDPYGSGFSAVRAASDIVWLSRESHAVMDAEAHERVRLALKAELIGLGGMDVSEAEYTVATDNFGTIPVRNLLAKLPGDSGTPLLIVGHYDSRGHIGRTGELGNSYGAADDGYAIATMLELIRLYKDRPLRNPVWFLFTDAEELGMYGAREAAKEPWMDQVGLVLNLEARGVSGPAYMFETGKANEKVLDLYARAGLPVSYSLATAVYSVMPNMTDFTEFVAVGKQGLNFAVLEGLRYYHAPGDNLSNIRLSSLQHYGVQLVPILDEYVSNPAYADAAYFQGAQDQVFFTLLPGVFVHYPESVAVVLNFVAIALLVALLVLLAVRRQLSLRDYGRRLLQLLGWIAAAALAGYLVSRVLAFLGKVPWKVTYVRMDGTEIPTLLTMIGAVAALWWFLKKRAPKPESKKAFLLATATVNVLFATLTGFALSGASFLFLVPALVGIVTIALVTFLPGPVAKHVVLSQNLLWGLLLAVPILYSLFIALTVGGLLALMVILMLFAGILVPSAMLQAEEG